MSLSRGSRGAQPHDELTWNHAGALVSKDVIGYKAIIEVKMVTPNATFLETIKCPTEADRHGELVIPHLHVYFRRLWIPVNEMPMEVCYGPLVDHF